MAWHGRKKSPHPSATELFGGQAPAVPCPEGRRLTLSFIGTQAPELDRLEFKADKDSREQFLQKGLFDDPDRAFRTDKVSKAIGLLFLDCLCASLKSKGCLMQGGAGSLAGSLCYAIDDPNRTWHKLFTEDHEGRKRSLAKVVFCGSNFNGKGKGARVIFPNPEQLPPRCIQIYWNRQEISGLTQVQALADQFRKAWDLPPAEEMDLPKAEVPPAPPPEPSKSATPPESKPAPKEEVPKATPAPDLATSGSQFEFKTGPEPPPLPPPPPSPPIDPALFKIQNPAGMEWEDSAPLLNFGDPDSDEDLWRIKDASEGLLIFGGVGSGKTSGSGSTVAQAFLRAGYGGLILTAKPDEAARWLRLCEQTGRAADCIHVTPTSGHQLNFLQYESQRPGQRVSITDDLIALFRCLIETMAHDGKNSQGSREDFWNNATDEVMRNLFDVFELSGEPLAIESLLRFLSLATTEAEKPLASVEYVSDLISRAQHRAEGGTLDDKRIFRRVFQYWTRDFAKLYAPTRSGIQANFSGMASILTGRGIYELVCAGTTLTPEMILSGKIVILDFPLKGNIKSGIMVQAAWKLLFQQAVERRVDKGKPGARPVFLWEDEGHLFFSHNDVNFQPIARDCRAAHVILSQNLHNFLHLGHNPHAVYAVFAAMNTYIFHTNGDFETNSWASQRLGEERKSKLRSSGLFRDLPADEISFFKPNRPGEMKSVGGFSFTEEKERAIPPEDFGKLKKGGDGTCQAIILWLSHQFAANGNKNYNTIWFEQEKRQ